MRCKLGWLRFALLLVAVTPSAIHAAEAAPAKGPRVYLVGKVSDEDLIGLTSALAGIEPAPVILFDTAGTRPYLKGFLTACKAERVVPVGSFADSVAEREEQLGVKLAPGLEWKYGTPGALWDALFPIAQNVVVCPAGERSLLLHAACLAGIAKAPLYVLRSDNEDAVELGRRVVAWKTREVFAVGTTAKLCSKLDGVHVTELPDEDFVTTEYLSSLRTGGNVETLVVTNPTDGKKGSGLSRLAPLLAVRRRAALLLTNETGDNVADVVRVAVKKPVLREVDAVMLLGDPRSIPTEKRPNPAVGKDTDIEMEPLTPKGEEPFTFATGRLFHEDIGVVTLTLARQRLFTESPGPHKALVASNPGGGLPLLEMFSRHTARELRNRGFETTAMFEDDVKKEDVRKLLPSQDIFLWEGHYRTLIDDYEFPKWTEPLRPSLFFLQSCLALNETEGLPIQQRGAVALVGSATRTYSGTGGAFTLAFFDAALYDGQSLGASLRQGKNYLLAYSLLKEKRLGDKAKLSGANVRSAWAFTLWGDPTLKLPPNELPRDAMPAVTTRVKDGTTVKDGLITMTLPEETYPRVTTTKYTSRTYPNARLAGLLTESGDEDIRQLVPFLFAEVKMTPPERGRVPHLWTKIPIRNWVFVWDARRSSGYLLVIPPARERAEVTFDVSWSK
jgi:hypothetical protein